MNHWRTVAILAILAFAGCREDSIERIEWQTMGTVAAVQTRSVANCAELTAQVKAVFEEVEKLLNAHDPESELNKLATLSDGEIIARSNKLVAPCYAAAFRLRDETDGVFNPRWRGERTMDLGAIAKGYAVDVAAERISGMIGKGKVLIDLGGNLKSVRGTWRVGIFGSNKTIELNDGDACATSAEYFRGKHIRDGRDGSLITNEVRSVTVVAPDATTADGLSTVMFLFGREKGELFLKSRHPDSRAIW